jgi:hypothetical protein
VFAYYKSNTTYDMVLAVETNRRAKDIERGRTVCSRDVVLGRRVTKDGLVSMSLSEVRDEYGGDGEGGGSVDLH